jgi:metal-sulfur cluster biosynthetic enzyme
VANWIMACVLSIHSNVVELDIIKEVDWISTCHVEMTIYYFDNPEAQCYCVSKGNENAQRD